MRRWWKRYLDWRDNPPPRPPHVDDRSIAKVDVDESDAIAHLYSNPGAPSGGLS